MTASEASRSFSTVLDRAESGETIVVTRSGRRVAIISPAPAANGAALRELFTRWQDEPALDDQFASRVEAARSGSSPDLDTDPWRQPGD